MTLTSSIRRFVYVSLALFASGCLERGGAGSSPSMNTSSAADVSPTATPIPAPQPTPLQSSTPSPTPLPTPPPPPYPHGVEAAELDSYVTTPAPAGGYIATYVDPGTIREDIYCPEIRVKWSTGLAQCWGTLPRTNAKKQYNVGLQRHLKVYLYAEIAQDNRASQTGPIYESGDFKGLTFKYYYCTSEGKWVTPDPEWYWDEWRDSIDHCKAGPIGE